jgi:hypothetical protein
MMSAPTSSSSPSKNRSANSLSQPLVNGGALLVTSQLPRGEEGRSETAGGDREHARGFDDPRGEPDPIAKVHADVLWTGRPVVAHPQPDDVDIEILHCGGRSAKKCE